MIVDGNTYKVIPWDAKVKFHKILKDTCPKRVVITIRDIDEGDGRYVVKPTIDPIDCFDSQKKLIFEKSNGQEDQIHLNVGDKICFQK